MPNYFTFTLFVDAELQAGDVRLTQGGEPTFVSVDNMDGAEWNIEALGQQKWELANVLMKKMMGHSITVFQNQFATGATRYFFWHESVSDIGSGRCRGGRVCRIEFWHWLCFAKSQWQL